MDELTEQHVINSLKSSGKINKKKPKGCKNKTIRHVLRSSGKGRWRGCVYHFFMIIRK